MRLAELRTYLKPESQNFLHLDALRFVAAYSVLLLHYRDVILTPGHFEILRRVLGVGSLFVDLFFIISGFIICHGYADRMGSAREYGSFIQKRIARLAPLHWATLAFYVAAGLAAMALGVRPEVPETFDWRCLLPNVALLHATGICESVTFNSVSWSISAELLLYLGFPLAVALYRRSAAATLAVGALMAIGLTLIAPHVTDKPWFQWSYDYGMIRAVPSFLIGMGLYGVRDSLCVIPRARGLVWALLGLLFVLAAVGVSDLWILLCVYCIAIAGVAADLGARSNVVLNTFASGGRLTYSIYMLHTVLFTIVVSVLGKYVLHLGVDQRSYLALACVVLILPFSLVSYVAFEMPLRKRLSRLGWSSR